MRCVLALIVTLSMSLTLPCIAVQTTPFVWVDKRVFAKYTPEQKLEYIKSMQAELIRQATELAELNHDSFDRLMAEAATYQKAASVLDGIWLSGNAAIAIVLIVKTTVVALGATAVFPIVVPLILAGFNLGIGLVGKGADYVREKAAESLKQAGVVADRLASDIQQAEQMREHALAMERLLNDVLAEVLRNDIQPGFGQPNDVVTESIPLVPARNNGNAIMEPVLEPHLGIDEFYSDLDPDQQREFLERLYTMFNDFRRQIDEFTRTRFDALVEEVRTDRNAAFGLNLAWMITHGVETVFFTVMYALMAQAVIAPQQWVEPVGLALTAIGTGFGSWADSFTRKAITALTMATQSARDFAKEIHERVQMYRDEVDAQHHQQRVAARVREVTGNRPAPPVTPPSDPVIVPVPSRNDPSLRAHNTLIDDKGKEDEPRREPVVEVARVAAAPVNPAPAPLKSPNPSRPRTKVKVKKKVARATADVPPPVRNENTTGPGGGERPSVLPAAFLGANSVTEL